MKKLNIQKFISFLLDLIGMLLLVALIIMFIWYLIT